MNFSKKVALQDVRNSSGSLRVDRLSSLPDELLLEILSWLPTKDAVVMCNVSRRKRHAYPSITSLDFNDSPTSFCVKHPYGTKRFPMFVSFVIDAIRAYQLKNLNSFRLQVGRDFVTRTLLGCNPGGRCGKCCFPDLKFPLLDKCICFPLTRCGLRELDLCNQVMIPGSDELPPDIFFCETLEVLKLDVNLGLDHVSAMSSFHLPNLKLFHISTPIISEDGFLTKLLSSCPLLEDLTVQAWWKNVKTTTISSLSLRRLCLRMYLLRPGNINNFVHVHTPNLEYLDYCEDLALHYSVRNMQCLVKADINVDDYVVGRETGIYFQQILSLIRPLSTVQHLSLVGSCVKNLDFVEVKDQLPLFLNLKYLELGWLLG